MKRLGTLRAALRDACRYGKHSSTFEISSTRSKLQGLIIRLAHGVEVGMIYRPTRAGFAIETVKQLLRNVECYINDYGNDSLIRMSLETLQEYCNLNSSIGSDFPEIVAETDRLMVKVGEKFSRDRLPIPITYEPQEMSGFEALARRRRSCREYTGKEVEQKILMEAIDTALYSPSACNRQPCRVYRVADPEKKKRVLQLQNNRSSWRGNASILVVTGDLGMYQGVRERSAAYVDGGLFCMSLAYALNVRGLGTCMLNLNMPEHDHDKMRRLLGAGEAEVLIMMIACGYTPGEVLVPKKFHRDAAEVLVEC